ncbi:hypothetical protein V5O48_007301 [Marasmius crinis-equi]|uniref:Uncharacterized protein n=1 Tax=Marasmius crinis-equi TaxID=585013 RepID=A0ABR3FH86_9AGAR
MEVPARKGAGMLSRGQQEQALTSGGYKYWQIHQSKAAIPPLLLHSSMPPKSAADLREELNHFKEGLSRRPPPLHRIAEGLRVFSMERRQIWDDVLDLHRLGMIELDQAVDILSEAFDAWKLAAQYRSLDSTHWSSKEQKLLRTSEKLVSLGREIESYKGTMKETIMSFIGANPFKERIKALENELRELRDYFTGFLGPGRCNGAGFNNYTEKHGDDFTNSTVGRTSRDVYNYNGTTYNTYS